MRTAVFSSSCPMWVLLVLFTFELPQTVRSLRWTKQPSDPTEAVEGSDVSLDWDYDLEGASFRQLLWTDTDSLQTIADWDRSGEPFISKDFRPRFRVDKNERATLIISSVNRTDSRRYSCKLVGDKGGDRPEVISTRTLRVMVPPQITLPPEDITVNESESAAFSCQASGDPKPNITWTRNGKDVGAGVNLTIPETKKGDAGLYNCMAHSKVASANASARLHINYLDAPKLYTSGNVSFFGGKSLTLQCSATGYPTPHVFWIDNKGNRHDGRLFTKEHADKNDEGRYRCFAKNVLGERSVSVFVTAVEPSKEQYHYRINFVIKNVKYNEKLAQAETEVFRNLSDRIRPLLRVLYNNRDITILKFSQGSVKVLFEVIYEKRVDESVVLAPLKEAVKDGVLGDGLEVDPGSVKIASDSCLLEPCVHGTCEEQGSGYKCSCDSVWKGTKCDDPVVIIVLAVVIPVVVVVLVLLLCFWHKRNQECRRDSRVKDGNNMNVSYANDGPQPEGEYATVQSTTVQSSTHVQYENVGRRGHRGKEQPQKSAPQDQHAVADKSKKTKKPAEGELNYVAVSTGPRQPRSAAPDKPPRQETTYADIAFRKDML